MNMKKILEAVFELFEMFFEVKKSSFSSRFFSRIAPLSSLEEAVETEVFHTQPSARTEGNRTCSDCRGEQQGKSLLLTFKQTIQNSFLMFLMAVAMPLAMSCSKEDGSNEEPLVANEYEYSGTMTVTAGGSDNVSEDVAVDCLLDKEASTMKILFHKVKFVPQMPISLDVTVPDVAYSEKNGTVEFSADGIVPLSGGTVPFPKYTVTALSGTLNATGLSLSLNFGDYPVTYVGAPKK